MNTSSHSQLTISGLDIFIDRKDIKNLHIGVYPPNGKIRVATPLKLDDEAVRLAVISRLAWIKKQRANFLNQPRQSPREMVSGESHYLFGKRYLLDVIYHNSKHQIIKKHSKLELHVKPNTTLQNRLFVLQEFYRSKLKIELEKLVDKWEKTIGITLEGYEVKKMRTKWGSCNIEKKKILLNLELVKLPIDCIEYIIVHEMAHLFERHHNENFQAIMDKFLPSWKEKKKLLEYYPLDSY